MSSDTALPLPVRIAVTGHRNLDPVTTSLVDAEVRTFLRAYAPRMVGISCLALGADQIFAAAVLDLGGTLEAVVPAREYGEGAFHALLAVASRVRRLPFERASPEAYAAANELLIETADLLVAVWDGLPARGSGGTAEAVGAAARRRVPVRVIWPAGAARAEAGVDDEG
ncbi:hypothetical protein GCM10010116_33780 [Microbispora rosea subsp. aerata]|nr:hypothetical protein [Microbispora rosea]GGO16719.1 hypothetical protein GCM10010116_33780 [Microbispora rosea subsp. aerata]GIH56010.1 hypothetical protein Mro02_29240 [Microbispora rosea subsp. aerata]GLJ86906.1 hypothetical protein GCM10017588_56480 [Microbispora rosea subsp. aerata]